MKLFVASSLLSLCVSSVAHAAEAPVGHVYLYDRDAPARPPQSQSVKPETARLIFAQRLGLSQFDSIENSDESVVQQLNWFGGRWQAPFHLQNQMHSRMKRVIVFVEGLSDAEQFTCSSSSDPSCKYSHFTMSSPPAADDNEALLSDFRSLSRLMYPPGSYSSGHAQFHEILRPLQLKNHDELVRSVHDNVFIHLDMNKVVSHSYEEGVTFVRGALQAILQLGVKEDMSLVIAFFPPASKTSKRSTNPYGKRDFRQKEEPLTFTESGSEQPSSAQMKQNEAAAPLASGSLARGIVPSCFSTLDACQSGTANCTGHGSCYRKYTDKAPKNRECWTCGCNATITTNARGLRKTTNWGGAACQKKDIVVPFWILAGFSILLVSTISWGVGLLYTMGEEELPSVIGAGVSGPRAK